MTGAELAEVAADPLKSQKADLVDFVLEQTVSPIDTWAVAATLESRGMRDIDAVEKFGKEGIFDLADEIYARCRDRLAASVGPAQQQARQPWLRRTVRFVTFYIKGTFFAMPMAVQIVSVILLGYALWSYMKFSDAQATAVAVGTILSFIVTGGFVQAIGRLGLFYGEQQSHILAYKICYRLIRLGMITAVVVGLVWWVSNLLTPNFSQLTLAISLVYYLLLSSLWLFLAVLYTLQKKLGIILATSVSVVLIGVFLKTTELGIYFAHWTGLGLASFIAWFIGYRALKKRAAAVKGDVKLAKLPRSSILTYSVAPYFAYGVFYFLYLFVDRIVGWSTSDQPLPFIIWFRTAYELGIDWALISLIPTIALLEYTINEFSALIIPTQKRFTVFQRDEHNAFFKRFFRSQVIALGVLSIISIYVTFIAIFSLRRLQDVQQARDFFANPITFKVYFLGATGYALLVWALLNGVFFFCLSRPFFVLRAIGIGIVTNALVGFVASRIFGYWFSAVGLVIGSLVFALVGNRYMKRVLNSLDYYYYAAY